MTIKGYDIFGDIHGHATALAKLLKTLGYTKNTVGVYYHKNRQAIFLGDFIDRLDGQAKVINIVKSMVDSGYALAIMGNHEFNAVCYHTKHPKTNSPFREHSKKTKSNMRHFLKNML
jgi:hypothetical protein